MYDVGAKLRQYAEKAQKCGYVKIVLAKHMHGKAFLTKNVADRAIAKTGNFDLQP